MYPDTHIYKSLFDHAREGLVLTDIRGLIELVNPRFLEIFGYKDEKEVLGQPIEIVLPSQMRQKHISQRHDYYKQPRNIHMGQDRFLQGQKKDGTLIFIEVSLSHFKNEEGELKVLGFVVDIDERVMTKKELDKERELNDLKSRFVSMVSHEFRTPLSSIHSSAILLGKYTRTDQQKNREKHLERIKKSVTNLVAILDDVLSLQKIEEDKIEYDLRKVMIPELMHDICEEMQGIATDGKKISYQHFGEALFYTDQKMLYHITCNLISNALKYSKRNGLIWVIGQVENSEFILKVKDKGIGIPDRDQDKLFDRFFRATNAVNIEGTGLGLSIVNRYVEMLKGSISFSSKENEFTTFIVRLPLLKQIKAFGN